MNDDDIERRLRRVLEATADAAVGDDYDLAARVPEPGRSHVMPAVAAAALVVTVAGGSAALAAVGTHHTHRKVTAQTTPATEASTSAQPQPSTVPSSAPAPTPTPREHYRVTPGMPYSTAAEPSSTRSLDRSTARTTPSAFPPPASTHVLSSTPSTASDAPSATRTKTRTSTPTHSPTTDPTSTSPTSTSPTTTRTTPAPEPGAACTSAELSLDIGGDRMVGTKGGDYTFMEIVNNGPTCTLDGYPTVRILNGSGATIGGPASHRSSPAPQRVTLTRNAAAEIELYDWNSSAPDCTADYGAGRTLQFTPPGQSTPVTISYGYSACQLSVSAIHLPQTHPVTD